MDALVQTFVYILEAIKFLVISYWIFILIYNDGLLTYPVDISQINNICPVGSYKSHAP